MKKNTGLSIGDRMKLYYETPFQQYLPRRQPVIIRLDGKSFHTLTRHFVKPHDELFRLYMEDTAFELCRQIQNVKLAYIQSDEISLLLIDYNNLNSEQYFGGNIQKIVSISASIASVKFSGASAVGSNASISAYFDSRVFCIPKEEVCNYFIWRQQDAIRNSILGTGQLYFSHKELQHLSCSKIQDKLFLEKGVNWNDTPNKFKRGFCIIKNDELHDWIGDCNIPNFTQNREYIEKYL